MSYLIPSTSLESLESTEILGQDAKSGKSQQRRYAFCCHRHACQLVVTWPTGNSLHTAAIDILDDDSLLNIFYLYRPFLLGEDDNAEARFFGGFE
jgi:hypothetical protein